LFDLKEIGGTTRKAHGEEKGRNAVKTWKEEDPTIETKTRTGQTSKKKTSEAKGETTSAGKGSLKILVLKENKRVVHSDKKRRNRGLLPD